MVLAIYRFPKWQTKRIIDFKSKRWQAENEFRKTLIQVFGGLIVILSLLFTWGGMTQSQRNFEKGQNITRFSQAISFLGANSTEQKIGGIYTLEQIAKESPEEYLGTVIEVLSAFVRNAEVDEIKEDAKKPEEKKEEKIKIKPETQIAVTVLLRIRTEDYKKHRENLPWINLVNAKLMGANLIRTNLTRADLKGVDLTRANLTGVYLTGALLMGANLTGADLRGADLTKAYFMEADLMEADLESANLGRANLTRANLEGANLEGAVLKGANLWEADLRDANLGGANLTGANLWDADIRGANLGGANLTGAKNLKVEQLLKAKTLFNVRGLPPEMEKKVKIRKPELFVMPK